MNDLRLHPDSDDEWVVLESPEDDKGYLVLARNWYYAGGGGTESTGVWVFRDELQAVEWLFDANADDAENTLDEQDYLNWKQGVESAIEEARARPGNSGITAGTVEYESNRSGLVIIQEGHWDAFVPGALDWFLEDVEQAIADEAEDWDSNDEEDDVDSEAEDEDLDLDDEAEEHESDPSLIEERNRLMSLVQRTDIHSADFIKQFAEACDANDDRHA